MSGDELAVLEREQRAIEARSQLVRARMVAEQLGAVVVFQDFRTGMALFHFAPETLGFFDLPKAAGGVA